MVLLMHHLVIANYLPCVSSSIVFYLCESDSMIARSVGGVDVPTAAHILHYNLDRYPGGYVPFRGFRIFVC